MEKESSISCWNTLVRGGGMGVIVCSVGVGDMDMGVW
jgi:hypothetical protein